MPKTEFEARKEPDNPGTIVSEDWLNQKSHQVPTGEDHDGSSPALYAVDTGAANAYAVRMYFGKVRASSANTSVSAGKLVDTGATFVTAGVQVGDTVLNLDDRTSAKVTNVDSETALSLDTDIFTASPKDYAVGPGVFQAPLSYVEGLPVSFKAANANTGASTLDINGLGTKAIKKLGGGTDLAAGDIVAGQVVRVVYDGTDFQMSEARVGIDHGLLSGLADDDHTQYYNSTRHTKGVHDALGILPGDATVSQAKLKTSLSSVEITLSSGHLVPTGVGSYGFYPQFHNYDSSGIGTAQFVSGLNYGVASYTTFIFLEQLNAGSLYAQFRYVTSSGEIYWVFLLRDKTTKKIIAASQAFDHCAFGNGGNPDEVPHPFIAFDLTNKEVIAITGERADDGTHPSWVVDIMEKAHAGRKDPLEIIRTSYEVDDASNPAWPARPVTIALDHASWTDPQPSVIRKQKIAKPAGILHRALKLK